MAVGWGEDAEHTGELSAAEGRRGPGGDAVPDDPDCVRAVAPVTVVPPATASFWARIPETMELPPMFTSAVPSGYSRTVAPARDASEVVRTLRWSMSSLALPPETVMDRIFSLSSATEAAVVLISETRVSALARVWSHWVETAL